MDDLSLNKKATPLPEIKQNDSSDKGWINEIQLDDFEDNLNGYPDLPTTYSECFFKLLIIQIYRHLRAFAKHVFKYLPGTIEDTSC